ncbi:MAG: dihydroneopterin aldolase [Saprospiraceae bacterium]|nr:dihydroneopterin aldolase [Saprospiraceae bacterium]
MATISLEGMQFYAYHGYYKEERIIGGEYIVDVYITTDVRKAAVKDDLANTINYETIYTICQMVMDEPAKLIETVAEKISLKIKHLYNNIKEMKVRVRKLNPPLNGPVAQAYVEVEGSFTKKCGRCQRPLLCYNDKTCWCVDTHVHKGQLAELKLQYGDNCLCKECLAFFSA